MLVAELETPRADSVIDDLLKKSKTKMWKLMVFEAKKNRKESTKIVGGEAKTR